MRHTEHVKVALTNLLSATSSEHLFQLFTLHKNWHKIVGKWLVKRSVPVFLKRRILTVLFEDQAYIQHARGFEEEYLSMIRLILKSDSAVVKLKFKVGSFDIFQQPKSPQDQNHNPYLESNLDPKLDPDILAELTKQVAVIQDPKLRKLCLQIRLNNFKT